MLSRTKFIICSTIAATLMMASHSHAYQVQGGANFPARLSDAIEAGPENLKAPHAAPPVSDNQTRPTPARRIPAPTYVNARNNTGVGSTKPGVYRGPRAQQVSSKQPTTKNNSNFLKPIPASLPAQQTFSDQVPAPPQQTPSDFGTVMTFPTTPDSLTGSSYQFGDNESAYRKPEPPRKMREALAIQSPAQLAELEQARLESERLRQEMQQQQRQLHRQIEDQKSQIVELANAVNRQSTSATAQQRSELLRIEQMQRELAEQQQAFEKQRQTIEAQRLAEQNRIAEEMRLSEKNKQAAIVEQRRLEQQRRLIEQQRAVEESRMAEAKRLAVIAKQRRIAEENRFADANRRAAEKRLLDEKKQANAQRRAEEIRLADQKQAEEQRVAEAQRKAELEQQRINQAVRDVEMQRTAALEKKRQAENEKRRIAAERAAEMERQLTQATPDPELALKEPKANSLPPIIQADKLSYPESSMTESAVQESLGSPLTKIVAAPAPETAHQKIKLPAIQTSSRARELSVDTQFGVDSATPPTPPLELSPVEIKTSVVGPEALIVGTPDEFEITITNNNIDDPVRNVIVQITIPDDLTISKLDRDSWLDEENRTVSWKINVLAGEEKETIRYSAVSNQAGRYPQKVLVGIDNVQKGETRFETVVITEDEFESTYAK